MGRLAAAEGMKLLYHNHFHEFQKFRERYGTRIRLLHQKDLARDRKTPLNLFEAAGSDRHITREVFCACKCDDDFVEIGTGCMDIQRIIDKAAELGSIRKSMEGFRRFAGLDWT